MKVAIAGARGIGKHHAKWYALAGCEVAAVYGTTPDSAAAAADGLRELFGFSGAVFSDWERFVAAGAAGSFEACSVCSPAERHWENVRDLAAAGIHLLCEKPLVWNWSYTPQQILDEAAVLVEAVNRADVVMAVNAQYPAALEGFAALHRQTLGGEPTFDALEFALETKGKPRSPQGAAEVWVDLAPHLLAFVDAVSPGRLDWESLRVTEGALEIEASFDWVSADRRLPVQMECRRIAEGTPRRRIGNQDLVADYDGLNVDGEFRARLRAGGQTWTGKDLMRVSVERFIEAVAGGDPRRVLVAPDSALRQQAALVGVWQRTWGRTVAGATASP